MAKDEQTKPKDGAASTDDKDVAGHNIFATQDYYLQRNIDKRNEIDRDVRERERALAAEEKNKMRR